MNDAAISSAAQELGYVELKLSQQRAIKVFVEGHNVFVCLLTVSGKSLCYGVLPLVFERLRGSRDHSHTGTEHVTGDCGESFKSPHEGPSGKFQEERCACFVCCWSGRRGNKTGRHVRSCTACVH